MARLSCSPDPSSTDAPAAGGVLDLVLPAERQDVARARWAVAEHARQAGMEPAPVADVALAVSEACANVVVHAARDRALDVELRVRACVEDEWLVVVVADDGVGMAPRTDSPGMGLGLPLMAQLSASLEFDVAPGGGTEVRMAFCLREGAQASDVPCRPLHRVHHAS